MLYRLFYVGNELAHRRFEIQFFFSFLHRDKIRLPQIQFSSCFALKGNFLRILFCFCILARKVHEYLQLGSAGVHIIVLQFSHHPFFCTYEGMGLFLLFSINTKCTTKITWQDKHIHASPHSLSHKEIQCLQD